jgi:hypothetical protein
MAEHEKNDRSQTETKKERARVIFFFFSSPSGTDRVAIWHHHSSDMNTIAPSPIQCPVTWCMLNGVCLMPIHMADKKLQYPYVEN